MDTLTLVAQQIDDGKAFLERLEREVAAARRDDPAVRARRLLQAYTEKGGVNAIRFSHSALCLSDGPKP